MYIVNQGDDKAVKGVTKLYGVVKPATEDDGFEGAPPNTLALVTSHGTIAMPTNSVVASQIVQSYETKVPWVTVDLSDTSTE